MKRTFIGRLQTSDVTGGYIYWQKPIGSVCYYYSEIARIDAQKYVMVIYGDTLGLPEGGWILRDYLVDGQFECRRGALIDLAVFERKT